MRAFLVTFITLFSVTSYAAIIELPSIGETYEIVEKDFLEFIKERAASIDMQAIIDENFDKAFERITTADEVLPKAPKTETRRITPSYTLEHEIFTLDSAGVKHVIYPAGFTYNPLDYMTMQEEYYIINARREAEVEWLSDQDLNLAMVIISEGKVIDFSEELDRPVYVLDSFVRKGMHIRYTPSKIRQEGNQLVVYEYSLEEVKDD